MRQTSRLTTLQNRVFWGGALSGRDIEAVNKTTSGLIKLLFPDPEMPVPDEELEWILRLALESRRRVKEQQKRCLKSEFRNTHFSFTLGWTASSSLSRLRSCTATRPLMRTRCRQDKSGR